jgi:hypothetical protein
VLGDDPQGALLSGAADHQRQSRLERRRFQLRVVEPVVLAVEAEAILGPEPAHYPTRLIEHVHPHAEPRERDSVLPVLFEPGGADAVLSPTARDVVDRGRNLGGHRRVPVGDAGHENRDAHTRCLRRHRRHHREPLEAAHRGRRRSA